MAGGHVKCSLKFASAVWVRVRTGLGLVGFDDPCLNLGGHSTHGKAIVRVGYTYANTDTYRQ